MKTTVVRVTFIHVGDYVLKENSKKIANRNFALSLLRVTVFVFVR